MNIVGNIISGQVVGGTAKPVYQRQRYFHQPVNTTGISYPAIKIAGLSSGQVVGAAADDPKQRIELKTFHCEILNDHDALKAEVEAYVPIPKISDISQAAIHENYRRIKDKVLYIIEPEMERIYFKFG
jgi:hypothetical protein